MAAARTYVGDACGLGAIPESIERDLWAIANAREQDALEHLPRLGRTSDRMSPYERKWRHALTFTEQFMALARDLACNRLLFVSLISEIEEPRVLTMACEEEPERGRSPRRSLGQRLGLQPERLVVLEPAVGRSAAYEVELRLPEGLQVTRADLETQADDPAAQPVTPAGEDRACSGHTRSRVHVSGAAQNAYGRAVFQLRPSAGIVRNATLSALLTAALLAAVLVGFGEVGAGAAGGLIALIAGAPAALVAAATVRSWHPATAARLEGVRALAILPALFAAVAATAIALGGSRAGAHEAAAGDWPASRAVVLAMLLSTLATAACLAIAWRRAARPPERRGGGVGGSRRSPATVLPTVHGTGAFGGYQVDPEVSRWVREGLDALAETIAFQRERRFADEMFPWDADGESPFG
jgi:hypothetical protein